MVEIHWYTMAEIRQLVKGPIKDRLYLQDTKFNSIQIVADGLTNNSKLTDVTMEHLWQLHVTAEETVIFSGERRRTFNCIGIGTNKDIDTVKILSVNQCPETNSDKDIADAKIKFKKIIKDFNELK